MLPRTASPGGAPSPRKLSEDPARRVPGRAEVAWMISGPAALGSTWYQRMCASLAPSARAART
ncbi:hypothetical protein BON30_27955 [Cystobacter ferrugineus]|uniref:Uncharacterized protein n=1 Tax=Cystobacter ferrugineus TaxID=83449 RepID=A0A1L9B4I0_9BACT|nr:hypothetical protein BON30_27955 [Cystobacter ferrugineus]